MKLCNIRPQVLLIRRLYKRSAYITISVLNGIKFLHYNLSSPRTYLIIYSRAWLKLHGSVSNGFQEILLRSLTFIKFNFMRINFRLVSIFKRSQSNPLSYCRLQENKIVLFVIWANNYCGMCGGNVCKCNLCLIIGRNWHKWTLIL